MHKARSQHQFAWHFLILLTIGLIPSPGLAQSPQPPAPAAHSADVVIYGGTSSAVIAAVQVKKMGRSVVVVCPERHLGGLSSGGLGYTDTGNKAVIGGLARDFYHRIWKHYQTVQAWKWQTRSQYGNQGQGTPAIDGQLRTMWIFEPHVAEKVFEDYVREYSIPVYREQSLKRPDGVSLVEGSIQAIVTGNGSRWTGQVFLDATYEGDLLAQAQVAYRVGRESNQEYGENWNGNQVGILHHRHHFGTVPLSISPYKIPGDPKSGLLAGISPDPPGQYGAADHRVQAYCFRTCLTKHPDNRVPFSKPDGYDPAEYALMLRILDAGWRETFQKFDPIPNAKTDTNNHGPFSFDYIGASYDYPEASDHRRQEIIQDHRRYQQGLLYFLAHDPRVPDDMRQAVSEWGLAKDEFQDNGHWPYQIYVREARRMVGQFVMTENHLLKKRPTPESIGMGSYTIDSHNVRRYVTEEGWVQNEGDIGVPTAGPYEIALGSILPKKEQCKNLVVPVCVSSTHIAFGSIRMEPVFMILGQSAGTLACQAIQSRQPVQDVPYAQLESKLREDGQILHYSGPAVPSASARIVQLDSLAGVVVDDQRAKLEGVWKESTANSPYVGLGYRHNGNDPSGTHKATFEAKLPKSGQYEVRIAYPVNSNRASNVPIAITHAGGTTHVSLSQRVEPSIDKVFHSLGTFSFDAAGPAQVQVGAKEADGYVVIDAVQWLPQSDR